MSAELTKVDSAIAGLSISPKDEKAPDKAEKKSHRRTSSAAAKGVWNIKDLGMYRTSWLQRVRADYIGISY